MSEPIHSINEHSFSKQGSPRDVPFEGHVISVDLSKLSKSDKSLERPFLDHLSEHFQRQDSPVFSATSRHAQYLFNDFLTIERGVGSLLGVNQDVQDVLGEAGAALVGTGAAVWAKGKEEEKAAFRALDPKAGQRAIDTQRTGKAEVALGFSVTASRTFGLATDTRGVNSGATATTSLGRATFSLGVIGGVFSTFWYAFIGLNSWNSLKGVWKLEEEFKDKSPKEIIEILRGKLKFGLEETIKVLRERHKEEPDPKIEFNGWCEDILSQETVNLAADFLQIVNPDAKAGYDFEEAAKEMTDSLELNGVTANGEDSRVAELGLSSKALIGFESLHRNRLEMAKSDLARSIGENALGEVWKILNGTNPTEEEIKSVTKSVEEGIAHTKMEDIVVLVFASFGAAVVVTSTVAACITCPPLGLIMACVVFSIALSAIGAGIDLNSLVKTWDAPSGKYEQRENAIKLLLGVGSIVGICMLSASTFGAFPLAVASFIVVVSVVRVVRTHQKKVSEKEIHYSMEDLLKKVTKLENDKPNARSIEKIKRIIQKKIPHIHKSISRNIEEGSWGQKIMTYLDQKQIVNLKEEVEKWKDAEDLIVGELKGAFETLGAVSTTSKSWMESFSQLVSGNSHLKRIFPSSSAEPA
ncbi:MAG: hypothetical protein V4489_01110 [Chlamydiota bacterium]